MTPRRFRIAFSFAGEKREFVAQVADILAKKFSAKEILYDKYHEAEFARHDLGIYLAELYGKQADLIVPVLCPKYDTKRWTGWEWQHIYGLLTKADGHRVMPSRFEFAEADGLSPTSGFIELDQKTPEQFAALILERYEQNERALQSASSAAARQAAAPSTTIPNNLPRLQPFFGREAELAQIREALDPGARTWGALIDGPGGMGKTSLAIRAAYDCPPGLFDRILFTSVKDREMDDDGERYLDTKLIPGFQEMLSELARELGLTDFGKSPDTERPRLLLEALRPLKVLLILDNLESLTKGDRDQLFTFVKRLPGGCKAILTSRRRLSAGAELLILEQLDQDAALALLADLARRNKLLAKTNEAERIVLYTQTGGKPLLLRWTAGQLGRGNCRTFTDAIAYLRSCPEGNDPLEFIFGDLARDFSDAETKVLVALTYFTQPATVEHIATVAGAESAGGPRARAGDLQSPSAPPRSQPTAAASRRHGVAEPSDATGESATQPRLLPAEPFDLAAVEVALRTLANRSLVVPDQEERAYTLVPMVADFLRQKRPEVVAETGNRLEKRAYALIVENGFEQHDRFPILDAAWPTVAPAIPLFVDGPSPRLQTVCGALGDFLNFTGRWDEKLALNLQAETKAIAAGDHDNAGWRAFNAGYVHSLREQGDAVLACGARAATHWTAAKAGVREQSTALLLCSLGHRLKRDYPTALAGALHAVELRRSLVAEGEDVATGLNDVAIIERHMKDYPAAERDYREALRIACAVGDAEGAATFTGNLASLALEREDWPGAEALAREALLLSENVGRKELVARDHRCLALVLLGQDRWMEALPHAQQALALYTSLGHPELARAQATLQQCQA